MPRILVVEDDRSTRELLERVLTLSGYEVICASDGAKAIALARTLQPDLIIMDMGLPILNGWQATHRLKSLPLTRDIPIIALTAYAMSADRDRCLSVGCNDYDVKPIDIERLSNKIQDWLARRPATH
jgi:CheY-like chemotaxis protein